MNIKNILIDTGCPKEKKVQNQNFNNLLKDKGEKYLNKKADIFGILLYNFKNVLQENGI